MARVMSLGIINNNTTRRHLLTPRVVFIDEEDIVDDGEGSALVPDTRDAIERVCLHMTYREWYEEVRIRR